MATNTPTYTVDPNDERLTAIKDEGSQMASDSQTLYNDMANSLDDEYKAASDAIETWKQTETQNQQERNDFTIEKIQQQQDKAQQDYLKEQSAAYVDWQKQSDQYGVNSEKMASNGLTGTGFSESSQVGMYNAYQSRVAVARESFKQAEINYHNAMNEARLQNNSVLAEIALEAMQKQTQLAIEGAMYKNNILLEGANKQLEIKNMYNQLWMQRLDQIHNENALNEQARQFDVGLEFEAEENQKNRDFQAAENALDRDHQVKLEGIRHEYDKKLEAIKQEYNLAYLAAQTEEEKKLIKERYDYDVKMLEKQTEEQKKILAQQLADQKSLLKYQKSLERTDSATIDKIYNNGNNGLVQGISAGGQAEVNTPYYSGKLNPDAKKYGTFSNGYQPKGISGHGKLKKSGDTITIYTSIQYGLSKGKEQALEQAIWKAEDGTLWYWDGTKNKYLPFKKSGGDGLKFAAATGTGKQAKEITSNNSLLNAKRLYD